MTDLQTRSAASRKAQLSRKRMAAARGLDPAIYGPEGTHRGSARIDGIHSIKDILARLPQAEAAE